MLIFEKLTKILYFCIQLILANNIQSRFFSDSARMEEFDWVEFFHNVKELMVSRQWLNWHFTNGTHFKDNGNMVTAVDDVKLAIDEFQLNRVTLELYEDFLVSLFTFGMQRLDDLMDQGMEHMEQDDDTQEDAFAATEAAFRRSIDVFKSINLACVPGFEEEIKANKMVLDVFTALLNHKFGFGGFKISEKIWNVINCLQTKLLNAVKSSASSKSCSPKGITEEPFSSLTASNSFSISAETRTMKSRFPRCFTR